MKQKTVKKKKVVAVAQIKRMVVKDIRKSKDGKIVHIDLAEKSGRLAKKVKNAPVLIPTLMTAAPEKPLPGPFPTEKKPWYKRLIPWQK